MVSMSTYLLQKQERGIEKPRAFALLGGKHKFGDQRLDNRDEVEGCYQW